MEAAGFSETFLSHNITTRRHNTEGCDWNPHRLGNIKSRNFFSRRRAAPWQMKLFVFCWRFVLLGIQFCDFILGITLYVACPCMEVVCLFRFRALSLVTQQFPLPLHLSLYRKTMLAARMDVCLVANPWNNQRRSTLES